MILLRSKPRYHHHHQQLRLDRPRSGRASSAMPLGTTSSERAEQTENRSANVRSYSHTFITASSPAGH